MRTEEQVKSGYFWLPSAPDKHFPGTLTIHSNGAVELDLIGFIHDNVILAFLRKDNPGLNEFIIRNESLKIPRLVGLIENGFVTLEQCVTYDSYSFCMPGLAKSKIYANFCLFNASLNCSEQISFNSFKFSVDGLDKWTAITGINVEIDRKTSDFVRAAYTPLHEPYFKLDNGMTIRLDFNYELPGWSRNCVTEVTIKQNAYFEMQAESDVLLDDFISVAEKIVMLVSLAVDDIVSIKDVFVESKSITQLLGDKACPVAIKLFYQSKHYSKDVPKLEPMQMFFTYAQVKDDMGTILNNWLKNYELVESSIFLYFAFKSDAHKYLESKFLALVQGLESYHRRKFPDTKLRSIEDFESLSSYIINVCPENEKEWLRNMLEHGNEISLRKRLKKIVEPFKSYLGSCNKRDAIVGKIYDTRNYLTHYDSALEEKAAKGNDLWDLCCKMEVFFQLNFLLDIGFSIERINKILDGDFHQHIRRKLEI